MIKHLNDPHNNQIAYMGMGPEAGPLPAFIYFALSADESLELAPYNHPTIPLAHELLRIFSFTIPGHGPGFDKFKAMHYWADQMALGEDLLESFFNEVLFSIQWLIDQDLIDPDHIAVGGLSRGGFIATHIAARDNRIHSLLGFSPLTQLSQVEEFANSKVKAQQLDLEQLVDTLTHIHHVRFYIGNRDTRVSTDACYHFIRQLVEKAHEKRARHCGVELIITPSIGHKGHGTDLAIFEEGARWVKQILKG